MVIMRTRKNNLRLMVLLGAATPIAGIFQPAGGSKSPRCFPTTGRGRCSSSRRRRPRRWTPSRHLGPGTFRSSACRGTSGSSSQCERRFRR